jgi:transglutaminase/protease-like cytokinesis protein 3
MAKSNPSSDKHLRYAKAAERNLDKQVAHLSDLWEKGKLVDARKSAYSAISHGTQAVWEYIHAGQNKKAMSVLDNVNAIKAALEDTLRKGKAKPRKVKRRNPTARNTSTSKPGVTKKNPTRLRGLTKI